MLLYVLTNVSNILNVKLDKLLYYVSFFSLKIKTSNAFTLKFPKGDFS